MGRDDRREERRHLPDRRHRRHPARAPAGRGPSRAHPRDPPGPRPAQRGHRGAAPGRGVAAEPARERDSTMPATTAVAGPRPRAGIRPALTRRPLAVAAAGIVTLLVMLVAGVAAGSVFVPPGDTLTILAHRLLDLDLGIPWTAA